MDNGNDDTRGYLVTALRNFADGTVVDLPTLTRFMKTLGEDLGRAGMAESAEDIARGMRLAGVETWGDMRLIDKQTLVENGGLRPLDALQFLALVEEARQDAGDDEPEGESLGSGDSMTEQEAELEEVDEEVEVPPAVQRRQQQRLEELQQRGQPAPAGAEVEGLQQDPKEGSKVSGDTTESMGSMASSMATVATLMSQQQQALMAATAKAARGDLPPLDLQDGLKPSVREVRQWMLKVAGVLHDVEGFPELVREFLRDPKGHGPADMQVPDPGGHIFMQVKGAAHGVYRRMGGGEKSKVGVLLYNIYKSSWKKERKELHRLQHEFDEIQVVAGVSTLRARHKEWVDALLEVMYSDWSSKEMVLESAEVVFQRFMPQVMQARRAAEALAKQEGEGQLVPEFIEQLAARVTMIANEYDAKQKKEAKAQKPGAPEGSQHNPNANPNRAARKAAARAKARTDAAGKDGQADKSRRCWEWDRKGSCRFGAECRFSHDGSGAAAVQTAQVQEEPRQPQTELESMKSDLAELGGSVRAMHAMLAGRCQRPEGSRQGGAPCEGGRGCGRVHGHDE